MEEAREALRRVSLELSVEEIQEKFQDYDRYSDHREDPELEAPGVLHKWRSIEGHLVGIWNYQARRDLNGRRPAELYMQLASERRLSAGAIRDCKVASMPREAATDDSGGLSW